MKQLFSFLMAAAILPLMSSCQSIKIGGTTIKIPTTTNTNNTNNNNQLTTDEVVSGLKEALKQGTNKGSDQLSAVNGYFGNLAIKILMPPEAKTVTYPASVAVAAGPIPVVAVSVIVPMPTLRSAVASAVASS